jgi:hypothetical protein
MPTKREQEAAGVAGYLSAALGRAGLIKMLGSVEDQLFAEMESRRSEPGMAAMLDRLTKLRRELNDLAAKEGVGLTMQKSQRVVSRIEKVREMVKAHFAAHGSPSAGMHKAHHDAMHEHLDGALSQIKAATASGDLAKTKSASAHINKALERAHSYSKACSTMTKTNEDNTCDALDGIDCEQDENCQDDSVSGKTMLRQLPGQPGADDDGGDLAVTQAKKARMFSRNAKTTGI